MNAILEMWKGETEIKLKINQTFFLQALDWYQEKPTKLLVEPQIPVDIIAHH